MSIAIAVPPREEQDLIIKWAEELFRPLDAAIAADRQAIALLEEFRTRLIADVVTGKLDVRSVKFEAGSVNGGVEEDDEEWEEAEAEDILEAETPEADPEEDL